MQYQHKVLDMDYKTTQETEEILNELGENGWRLVAVEAEGHLRRVYLVRENP